MLKMLFSSAIEKLAPYTWAFRLAFYGILLGIGAYGGTIYAEHDYLKEKVGVLEIDAKYKREYEAQLYVISGELEKLRMERRQWGTQIEANVETVVQRDSYSAVCVDDDGLRVLNAALIGLTTDSGEFNAGLSSSEAATRRDSKSGNAKARRGRHSIP